MNKKNIWIGKLDLEIKESRVAYGAYYYMTQTLGHCC